MNFVMTVKHIMFKDVKDVNTELKKCSFREHLVGSHAEGWFCNLTKDRYRCYIDLCPIYNLWKAVERKLEL